MQVNALASLLLQAFCVSASAQALLDTPNTTVGVEELGTRLMQFHANASKEEFQLINRSLGKHVDVFGKEDRLLLAATFLARAAEKHDYQIEGDNRITRLANAIQKQDKGDATVKFVLDDSELSPTKLDIWWASFFATGAEQYLSLILNQTGDIEQLKGKDAKALLIVSAANWSFKANCRQHPSVRAFANRALKDIDSKKHHDFLRDCVARADD